MSLINVYPKNYLQAKVAKFSSAALTDRELLTFLFEQHYSQNKSKKLVDKFFKEYESLGYLEYFTLTDWQKFLADADKAAVFASLCEFARRYRSQRHLNLGQIYSSKEVGEFLIERLGANKQECLVLLVLDNKNQLLDMKTIFKGTLNSSLVHPREIFNFALRYSAARFMVAHNHPSGNLQPSQNDLAMTKRLQQAGEIMGIELLDHIIVGNDNYLSMREEGIIN